MSPSPLKKALSLPVLALTAWLCLFPAVRPRCAMVWLEWQTLYDMAAQMEGEWKAYPQARDLYLKAWVAAEEASPQYRILSAYGVATCLEKMGRPVEAGLWARRALDLLQGARGAPPGLIRECQRMKNLGHGGRR